MLKPPTAPPTTAGPLPQTAMTPQERQLFTDAYTRGGEYAERADLLNRFLDNPEQFTVRSTAIRRAYEDFVMRPAGLNRFAYSEDETLSKALVSYAIDEIRNVRIELEWGLCDWMGHNAPVKNLIAEVRQPDGTYRTMESGGVAFDLSDWIQEKI